MCHQRRPGRPSRTSSPQALGVGVADEPAAPRARARAVQQVLPPRLVLAWVALPVPRGLLRVPLVPRLLRVRAAAGVVAVVASPAAAGVAVR
jgi:hypothetical protein